VEFWTGIVKVVFVVAIGTFYYTNPLMLANGVEKASNELTNMIVKTSTDAKTKSEKAQGKEKNDKKTAITYIANDLWEQYVHKPWRILEFGDNKAADKWENDILKKSPDEREGIIKDMEADTGVKTEAMVTKRLGFMIMYLIPVAINIILMGIFCVIIIGLQFVVMLVFILGIFVFMVALIPSFGIETLKKWGMSIAFLSGTKLIMAFMLMLILAFNSALYSYAQEEGWVYALMLQLAMYIALYLFRHKVFYIFAMAKEVAVNPKKAFDRLQKTWRTRPI
jgi:cation transport ATPase